MQSLIENYINGNLTDAKRQAKRVSFSRLRDALANYGYGYLAAESIALFLKGEGSYQAACDAEAAERATA